MAWAFLGFEFAWRPPTARRSCRSSEPAVLGPPRRLIASTPGEPRTAPPSPSSRTARTRSDSPVRPMACAVSTRCGEAILRCPWTRVVDIADRRVRGSPGFRRRSPDHGTRPRVVHLLGDHGGEPCVVAVSGGEYRPIGTRLAGVPKAHTMRMNDADHRWPAARPPLEVGLAAAARSGRLHGRAAGVAGRRRGVLAVGALTPRTSGGRPVERPRGHEDREQGADPGWRIPVTTSGDASPR